MTKPSRLKEGPNVEVYDEWGESAIFERGRPVATLVRLRLILDGQSNYTDSRHEG